MSKITNVGGSIKKTINGDFTTYTGEAIEYNVSGKLILTCDGKMSFETPNVAPVKETNDFEKEGPWLVLRSSKKKGRNATDTATADDLLYGDYVAGIAKLYKELSDLEFKDCNNRKEANEFAKSRINKLKQYLEKTNEQLFAIFENDIKWWSKGELEDVAVDIVDKMKKNTGGFYSSKAMTSAAKNHATFVNFAYITEWCIADFISKKKKIEDLLITMDAPLKQEGKLYKAILDQNAEPPLFNTVNDTVNGLRILVNGVWAYELRILRYRKVNTSLFVELEYILYDHFGLDVPDIHKFDKEIFYVWFILQHFRGFKPLITKMKINREFPMIVSENWK